MERIEKMSEERKISDMELMMKLGMFMKKARMGGRGMPGAGPFGHGMRPFGGPEGHRPPCRPDHMPPMPPCGEHRPPHGMRRPPLSRERLLILIGENPDGIRQKAIAERVGINPSSASELIDKLESDGYIERKVDPNDKRATLLFLTEKGQARAAEVSDEREAMFKDIFSPLTEEEKQTLSDLLDKLLKAGEES